MKISSIFILLLVLMTFSNQAYARVSEDTNEWTQVEQVGFSPQFCFTAILQAFQIAYSAWQVIGNQQWIKMISLIIQTKNVVLQMVEHCIPESIHLSI